MKKGMPKKRADTLLVEQRLAESREQAHALILAGKVFCGDRRVEKAATPLPGNASLHLVQGLPFVGRGGVKLEHALHHFFLEVKERVILDVGASVGGFTHCLLKQGAARVYALDVGYGQLAHRLRQDSRVVVMERVNARYPFPLPEEVSLITADVSFISLTKVLPSVVKHLRADGHILALVKPQFEAGPKEVGRRGVVRDPQVHATVVGRFCLWGIGQGWCLQGITPSPILGDAGNREFFVLLQLPLD